MKKTIVANWKCNPPTKKEAQKLLEKIKKKTKNKFIVCPPFPFLDSLSSGGNVKLGAQNCFWREGSFTGEVSPAMIKSLGVKFVILGHSERRNIFKEDSQLVNKKIKEVLKKRMNPIVCLGENSREEKAYKALEKQLRETLKGISREMIKKLFIAYEPVWAIGSGNPCSPRLAITRILFLRKIISEMFSRKTAREIKILYGGSIKGDNAENYLKEKEIDGLLIGGASLDSKEFIKILSY